jgi:hypothetical protein
MDCSPRRTCAIVALAATAGIPLLASGCSAIDKQAAVALQRAIGHTSVTVFPAFVRDGGRKRYDPPSAMRIGEFLQRAGLATPTVSQVEVPISSQWHMNQARMFKDSAADLGAHVVNQPIDTEYALLPEYLIGRGEVVGVHVYLVDAQGRLAYGALLNSHHPEFRQPPLKSPDDCTSLVIRVLESEWKRTVPD